MKMVFIMRHPCAVVHSQGMFGWPASAQTFLAQPDLLEDLPEAMCSVLHDDRNMFERRIIRWAVENYVPLKQLSPKDVHLVFYEQLCSDPNSELQRLFSFLKRSFPKGCLSSIVSKPSSLSRPESSIVRGHSLTDDWRTKVSPQQARRAVEILSVFGLDKVYHDAAMPNAVAAYEMLKK
jgi:hypothetical protein